MNCTVGGRFRRAVPCDVGARGDMENQIKERPPYLFADSCRAIVVLSSPCATASNSVHNGCTHAEKRGFKIVFAIRQSRFAGFGSPTLSDIGERRRGLPPLFGRQRTLWGRPVVRVRPGAYNHVTRNTIASSRLVCATPRRFVLAFTSSFSDGRYGDHFVGDTRDHRRF